MQMSGEIEGIEVCGSQHPEVKGITCHLRQPNHPLHGRVLSWKERYDWPNEEFIAFSKPSSLDERRQIAGGLLNAARQSRRRSVGSSDTMDRLDGIDTAHGSMEPEFVEQTLALARELSLSMERWTVDDLWELLDARDVYTEHPKGMTGLLRRLQSEGVIVKVQMGSPDSHRQSSRTNASRLVQVYVSLIHPISSETDTV